MFVVQPVGAGDAQKTDRCRLINAKANEKSNAGSLLPVGAAVVGAAVGAAVVGAPVGAGVVGVAVVGATVTGASVGTGVGAAVIHFDDRTKRFFVRRSSKSVKERGERQSV